jgi:rod shape-determining protein MreD
VVRLSILFALFTAAALAVETAVPYWFPLRILIPNLIVILIVDLGLRHHGALPVALAFAIGYATDAFSGTTLGLNALLATIVYLMAYAISSRLMVTTAFVGAVTVFVAVMLTAYGTVLLSAGLSGWSGTGSVFPRFAVEAGVSAIAAPIIFAFTGGLKRLTGLPAGLVRE